MVGVLNGACAMGDALDFGEGWRCFLSGVVNGVACLRVIEARAKVGGDVEMWHPLIWGYWKGNW